MVLKNEIEEDKSVWAQYEDQTDSTPKQNTETNNFNNFNNSFGPTDGLIPVKLDSNYFKQ